MTRLSAFLVAGLVGLSLPGSPPFHQPAPPAKGAPTRHVYVAHGKPLLDLLEPEDTVLLVEDPSPGGATSGIPPGRSLVQYLTEHSSFVGIVDVEDIEGILTADRGWVDSVISARIVDTAKIDLIERGRTAAALTFVSPGGTLSTGSQQVRAFRSHQTLFQPGGRYLVFAAYEDGALRVYPSAAFAVDGERLAPLQSRSFSGQRMPRNRDEVMTAARAAAQGY